MRLSPKAIFVGLVLLGLPIAVTVGWSLGEPSLTPTPSAATVPGGAAGIGTAPGRALKERPKPVDYIAPAPRTGAPSASSSAPVAALPSDSASPSTLPTLSRPPLTDSPVPTPTMVTSQPSSPSATPSTSPSTGPSDVDAGWLLRKS